MSTTPSQPTGPPPPFIINPNTTAGLDLIGLVFGAVFHGITTLQTIFYYRTYPKDGTGLKFLVGVLWILDTLSLAMIVHGVYTYLVVNFGNSLAVVSFVWSISSEPIVAATVALVVHLFLVYRIWALNKSWLPLVAFLIVFSLFPFALAIVVIWKTNTGNQNLGALKELHWMAITGGVTTSSLDLIIAASICYLLYRNRTGLASTRRIINLITLYLVSSGLITTALNMAVMISYLVAPTTFYFQLFNISVSKAYANTFLATLNMRRSVRGRASETVAGTTISKDIAFRDNITPAKTSSNSSGMRGREFDVPLVHLKSGDTEGHKSSNAPRHVMGSTSLSDEGSYSNGNTTQSQV